MRRIERASAIDFSSSACAHHADRVQIRGSRPNAGRRVVLLFAVLGIVSAMPMRAVADGPYLPGQVLSRVFAIRFKQNLGSAFTIEVDKKQYLLTARHVVPGIHENDIIQLKRVDGSWTSMKVRPIFPAAPEVDIAALVLPEYLATGEVEATLGGSILGQEMFFLGFPFHSGTNEPIELGTNAPNMSSFPMPFVKHGLYSAFDTKRQIIYLDGNNNKGFSGGPIVFFDASKRLWKIAGVVSAYLNQRDEVIKIPGGMSKSAGEATGYFTNSNTGIVVGYSVKPMIDELSRNPKGIAVPEATPTPVAGEARR